MSLRMTAIVKQSRGPNVCMLQTGKSTEPAGTPAQQCSCRDEQHRNSRVRAATKSTGTATLVPYSAAPAQQRLRRDQEHRHSNACAATRSTGTAALVPQSAAPNQQRLRRDQEHRHSGASAAFSSTGTAALVPRYGRYTFSYTTLQTSTDDIHFVRPLLTIKIWKAFRSQINKFKA
ncbi:hypothetical protein B5X24_HaOG208976 [Helicoverpa armigera]|uniref:Uncharacterized protein n=1 Tax=Helicoverpa armigera TaxID=29058 RepID=A0A2W1BJ22_HELAM|nr:hypothetical protein B5X24_HaOG208976 [Helicoverpa armigera]